MRSPWSLILAGAATRLAAAICLSFFLFQVLPGDPVLNLDAGRPVTAREIALQRHQFGLDRSIPVRFGRYLCDLARGRLGVSYAYHRPVGGLLLERLGPTVLLTGSAAVLAAGLGFTSGTLAGWRPGGRFDRIASAVALVLWATPTAWLGLLLLIGLGTGAGPLPAWFPIGGMRSTPPPHGFTAATLDVARHLVLPCVTLVAVQYGQYHLLLRAGVLRQRGRLYVSLARATGLRDAQVRRHHVLPNAVLPAVTQLFVSVGFVLSGAVAVETVFSWPGLGYLAYQAVQLPDLPVLNGTFLVFCAGVVVVNLVGDLVVAYLDPRSQG